MRLVVDNPNPEPETGRGSPVAVAVMTVAVFGALGSGALLAVRALGAMVPAWTVLAPLGIAVVLCAVLVALAVVDRRDAA